MLAYLYTSDYCDGDPSGPAAVVASPEEVLADVLEDEERSVSTSQSIAEEQDDAFAITDEPSLLNNVLVYAIGEKYGIAELKEMAKVKFQGRAGEPFVCDGVPRDNSGIVQIYAAERSWTPRYCVSSLCTTRKDNR